MKHNLIFLLFIVLSLRALSQPTAKENLVFDSVATRWDEAMPLGNGWLGALIWQKGKNIRLSLDRVDLWDDRPMPEIDKLRFKWVTEQVKKKEYGPVQKIGDEPYEKYPAPTKIPGVALEFDLNKLGKVLRNELDIKKALSTITFENGATFKNYLHAARQVGYFSLENCWEDIVPQIKIPPYNSGSNGKAGNSVEGQGLEKLGYAKGSVENGENFIRYHQPTWNGNFYEVLVQWTRISNTIMGQWTITQNVKATLPPLNVALKEPTGWDTHIAWWNDYWSRSAITIPDAVLLKQYYLDMYKFGCVARSNTPPISLQAIWTADNGNLPPWKGDFHHDLNTELSYWPGYTGNHLDLTESFTNWLWKIIPENIKWTKQYFESEGLNVPGVTTISGKPMGGWIQYAMSPTTAAWLSQHFYWQWKYSLDEKFLKERCRPYFDAVGKYLSTIRVKDTVSQYARLPLSSTPEHNDNSINAWFLNFTNYDLALVKNFYREYIEVLKTGAKVNPGNITSESKLYPALDTNYTGLTIAPGQNLTSSHRHHSHLMAIYPAGVLDITVADNKKIVDSSLRWLEKKGTRAWVGYSFSWAACLYAKAKDGDNAAKMLGIFAKNFVSKNSFHLNGDQRGGQHSGFTYRPFTLEGNFAYAQGIHEMLIQSANGYVEIFPAIPANWKDVSFKTLRTENAFLVSASKKNGNIHEVKITAEAGGLMQLKLPFKTFYIEGPQKKYELNGNILTVKLAKGETILFKNGFE